MRRTATVAILVSASLLGVLAWQAVVRQRDYRRFIDEGDRLLAAEQPFLAVEAYTYAIAARDDAMLAYLKRGEAYRKGGETSAALRDLRTAAKLDPAATRPLELLGDVNVALDRFANAQESYQAYLRLDERSPRVLYKLALTRHRMGQPQAAVAPLRQAVTIDDRFAAGHYLLGLCLHAVGQVAEATGELERAISLDPGMNAAREELAQVYAAAHRDKDAIGQLEALAALEPGRPERQVALGSAYGRAGMSEMAVMTLRRVAEEHPEDPDVYAALGRIWLEAAEAHRGDRGELSKAMDALATATRRSPPGSGTLLLLGRAQLLAGDTVGAERSLSQAAAQFPIEPEALLQLATVAERAGHLGTARDALGRYTAISGDGMAPFDRATHLGDLSMRLNEPAAAVAWYAKAAESESAAPVTFSRLAEAQFRAGDRDGALATIERGLKRDGRDPTLLLLQRRVQAALAARR